ncbi:MAG: endonuclease/exonuclease/phosphatase family protein [Rhodospirillales bacterium]|nr:endonuclease/exonuclease/phosphatase family protein [Rhodospirillales bacterium]
MSSVGRGSISVVSYNVHRCFGADRKYDPPRTANVLAMIDADIVGLQEVDVRLDFGGKSQLEYLSDRLGLAIAARPRLDHARFGNALLTRLPVSTVRQLDLGGWSEERRTAIEAEIRQGETSFSVLVVHLGLERGERSVQVRRLLDGLSGADLPMIVMGDVNEWWPNGALSSLNRRFGAALAPRTFPSRFPILRLDRIWVWPPAGLQRYSVFASPTARIASDHLPVRAEVDWSVPISRKQSNKRIV